jgi:hypothetical protein
MLKAAIARIALFIRNASGGHINPVGCGYCGQRCIAIPDKRKVASVSLKSTGFGQLEEYGLRSKGTGFSGPS